MFKRLNDLKTQFIFLSLLALLKLTLPLHAQSEEPEQCAFDHECVSGEAVTDYVNSFNITNDPLANAIEFAEFYQTDITLSVVVHVITNPYNQGTYVSDEAIQEWIQLANNSLAGELDETNNLDTGIELCLATKDIEGLPANSIIRYESNVYADIDQDPDQTQDFDMKEFTGNWDANYYLNIWIVDNIYYLGDPGSWAYAYPPDSHGRPNDGIVIEAEHVSTEGGPNILTHEVGHYLGLKHTYQGDCQETDCHIYGDQICDRPPNTIKGITCAKLENGEYLDCYGNYYEPNDFMNNGEHKCLSRFSIDQNNRMWDNLIAIRPSLLLSSGCEELVANDASICKIMEPLAYACDSSVEPVIEIANAGENNLYSLEIWYGTNIDNLSEMMLWNGNLASGSVQTVYLDEFSLAEGEQEFYVELKNPNGTSDEDTDNDILRKTTYFSKTILSEFYQDMENGFPLDFYVENPDNRYGWETSDITGCSDNGNKAIMLQNFKYNNDCTRDEFTLKMNLDAFGDSLYLQFDMAYIGRFLTKYDPLEVSLRPACEGDATHALYTPDYESQVTLDGYSNDYFTPTSCEHWKTVQISLDRVKNDLSGIVYITFTNINGSSNNIYIDNLRIYSSSEIDICQAPTNLMADVQENGEVDLSWENIDHEEFIIKAKLATEGETAWVIYDTIQQNNYTLTNLLNEDYEVKVGGVCANGEVEYASSNIVVSCLAPEEIWVIDAGVDYIQIEFPYNQHPLHMLSLLNTATNEVSSFETTLAHYTFENLDPNTEYIIELAAICNGGASSTNSISITQSTQSIGCEAPNSAYFTNIESNSATLTYEEVIGASLYYIFIDGVFNGISSTHTAYLTNLNPNTLYNVEIVAVCGAYLGETSESFSFTTTGNCLPADFELGLIGSQMFSVEWTGPDAFYFDVQLRKANTYDDPEEGWDENETSTGELSYMQLWVPQCGEYEVRILTYCLNGQVSYSDTQVINTCPVLANPCNFPEPIMETNNNPLILFLFDGLELDEGTVKYKPVGNATWEGIKPIETLTDIVITYPCLEYLFEFEAICYGNQEEVIYQEVQSITYTPDCLDEDLCTIDTAEEGEPYIQVFGLGGLYNTNEDNDGYLSSIEEVQLVQGGVYNITLQAGGTTQDQYWKVWIDYDGDYIMTESEVLLDSLHQSTGSLVTQVTIPEVASITTLLRVAMQTDAEPLACGPIINGEVEDYNAIIGSGKTNDSNIMNTKELEQLVIYPNPAHNIANMTFMETKKELGWISIYNINGQLISSEKVLISEGYNNLNLDVQSLPEGLYCLSVQTENTQLKAKLMISHK